MWNFEFCLFSLLCSLLVQSQWTANEPIWLAKRRTVNLILFFFERLWVLRIMVLKILFSKKLMFFGYLPISTLLLHFSIDSANRGEIPSRLNKNVVFVSFLSIKYWFLLLIRVFLTFINFGRFSVLRFCCFVPSQYHIVGRLKTILPTIMALKGRKWLYSILVVVRLWFYRFRQRFLDKFNWLCDWLWDFCLLWFDMKVWTKTLNDFNWKLILTLTLNQNLSKYHKGISQLCPLCFVFLSYS